MHHISMEVAEMLSALRSTLEDPSGAATTSGAAQEHSAPVMPQLLPAGAPPGACLCELRERLRLQPGALSAP